MATIVDMLALSITLMQLGTVAFLLFGPIRRYAFVLAYCLMQLGTSLLEVTVEHRFGPKSKIFNNIFWADEIGMDLLLFLILILLTYRAMERSPLRAAMGKMLGAVVLIVVSVPFAFFPGAFRSGAWFNSTSQMLNFGAAVLNLGLWTALLGSKKRDPQLLTVSAAFGLVATGVAISFGFRRLIQSGPAFTAANLVFTVAHLAGAAVLCWAFRPSTWKKQQGVTANEGSKWDFGTVSTTLPGD